MSEDLTREEVVRAVDELVVELLDDAGVVAPPIDAVALARHLGLELAAPRARRGFAAIEPTPEQRQRDAAAELGVHLKADLLSRLGIDPDGPRPMLGESLSRLFSERLLVPTAWLTDEGRSCGFDLLELKQRFTTASHEAIAWRLLDLDQPCVITVLDGERVVKRRGNTFNVGKELSPAERACLRDVRRHGTTARATDEGWDVRGWPTGGRVVLRSVTEE